MPNNWGYCTSLEPDGEKELCDYANSQGVTYTGLFTDEIVKLKDVKFANRAQGSRLLKLAQPGDLVVMPSIATLGTHHGSGWTDALLLMSSTRCHLHLLHSAGDEVDLPPEILVPLARMLKSFQDEINAAAPALKRAFYFARKDYVPKDRWGYKCMRWKGRERVWRRHEPEIQALWELHKRHKEGESLESICEDFQKRKLKRPNGTRYTVKKLRLAYAFVVEKLKRYGTL